MRRIRQTVVDQSVLLLLALLPATQLNASPLVFPLFDLPNIDKFGQYPILQFGAVLIAFVVTVAGILGWKKGEKMGQASAASQAPVAELHFDGPIRGIFDALSDIKARQLLARLEIKDDFALLLSGSRNSIVDKLAGLQADLRDCIGDCARDINAANEARARDLQLNINSLHERMDEYIRNQVTIMERLRIKRTTGRG